MAEALSMAEASAATTILRWSPWRIKDLMAADPIHGGGPFHGGGKRRHYYTTALLAVTLFS